MGKSIRIQRVNLVFIWTTTEKLGGPHLIVRKSDFIPCQQKKAQASLHVSIISVFVIHHLESIMATLAKLNIQAGLGSVAVG